MRELLKKIGLSIVSGLFVVGLIEALCWLLLAFQIEIPQVAPDTDRVSTTYPFEIQRQYHPPHNPYPQTFLVPPGVIATYDHTGLLPNTKITILRPNFNGTIEKKIGDKIIYSAQVSTDSARRRVSRSLDRPSSQMHMIFLGCSFVFGDGVNDLETLPAHINQLQSRFEAYNVGQTGHGPNDTLAILLTHPSIINVPQKKGIGFFVLIDDHIQRAIGTMSVIGTWGAHLSEVNETDNGKFIYSGSYKEASPLKRKWYSFLSKTALVRATRLDLPPLTTYQYNKVARMLAHIKSIYQEQTDPTNPFYVVIHPKDMKSININKMKAALSQHNIHFIDYSTTPMYNILGEPTSIELDGHPTSASHKKLAEMLIKDLNLKD